MKWCEENCSSRYVWKLCWSGGMTDDQLDMFCIHRVSVHGKCAALTRSSKTLWCWESLGVSVTKAKIMLQLWSRKCAYLVCGLYSFQQKSNTIEILKNALFAYLLPYMWHIHRFNGSSCRGQSANRQTYVRTHTDVKESITSSPTREVKSVEAIWY